MLNLFFKKSPFVRMVIPMIIGIIIAYRLPMDNMTEVAGACLSTIVLFVLAVLWQKKYHNYKLRYVTGLSAFLVFFTIGVLYTQLRYPISIDSDKHSVLKVQLLEAIGTTEKSIKYEAQLYAAAADSLRSFYGCRGMVFVPKGLSENHLSIGDWLYLSGRFIPFSEPVSPFDFDYSNYLRNQRIAFRFLIEDYSYAAAEQSLLQPVLLSAKFKGYLRMKYQDGGLNDSQLAILNALFLGDKSLLSYEQKSSFSDAGAMHLLAVSGLHVGIIYMLLLGIASVFGIRKHNPWATSLIVVMLWMYAGVTGFSPSVLRASLMFSILEFGRLSNKQTGIFNLLGASMFIILIIEPLSVFNIGFWLSHAAVASIVSFYSRINGWIHFRFPPFRWIWSIIAVSLAAQIGTLPIGIFAFHEFPLYFVITNVLLIPVVTPILLMAVLAAALSFWPFALEFLVPSLGSLLTFMENSAIWIDELPYSSVTNLFIDWWQLPLFYSSVILLLVYINYRFIHYLKYLLASLVILVLSFHIRYHFLPDEVLYVANIKGKSVVNYVDATTNVIYTDTELNAKEIEFAFNGLWAYCNAPRDFRVVSLNYKLNSRPIVTLIGNRTIVIVPEKVRWEYDIVMKKIDYLVLMGKPDMSLKEIRETMCFRQLIIPSGWKWYHKKWLSDYSELDDILHDTTEQGVFYLAFYSD